MRSLFLLVGSLAVVGCGADESAAPDPSIPAVEVTSVDLAKSYAENEVAAQKQYGESPLLVSGTIESIELDMMDEPVVMLTGSDDFSRVHVSFEGDASEATSSLSKGGNLTVRCAEVSEIMGSPMLDGCIIQ